MKYEWFIGLRYLKAKRKQTFISIITVISIAGVMVGVMALIVVLAVMSGFEKTLKEKILGTQAHLHLLKATQEGWINIKRSRRGWRKQKGSFQQLPSSSAKSCSHPSRMSLALSSRGSTRTGWGGSPNWPIT